MICKMIEIRDVATFIPALAVRLEPACEADRYLLARAGYGRTAGEQAQYVQLVQVNGGGGTSSCDPYDWPNGTMRWAHMWLIEHFDEVLPGGVVDVEFIRGLSPTAKLPERLEAQS